jgi:hypothetical protein
MGMIIVANDVSQSHFDGKIVRSPKEFRMSEYGVCGMGSQYVGMTIEEIIEEDEADDSCEGTDILCEIYATCQAYDRRPGSIEHQFIESFDVFNEDGDFGL